MTKFSEKGENKHLRDAVKRLEGRIKVLETIQSVHDAKIEEYDARLQKLEVVRVPSPTVEPDYPARPETE